MNHSPATNDFVSGQELRTVKERIAEWVNALTKDEDISIEQALKLTAKYAITLPLILNSGALFPNKLYRVRVIEQNSEEDITNPKTFSYPPAEYVKHYQRANAPFHPVFYGAMDGQTAFEEVKINGERQIEKGDVVFLSEWRVKPLNKYRLCYISYPGLPSPNQGINNLVSHLYEETNKLFANQEQNVKEEQTELLTTINELFLTGKHILSGTLAHKILYEMEEVYGIKVGGIIYPSCSNGFRSLNCALHPKFIEDCLELVKVRRVTFDSYTESAAFTTGKHAGYPSGNHVRWGFYYCIADFDGTKFTIEGYEGLKAEKLKDADILLSTGEQHKFMEYLVQFQKVEKLAKINLPEKHEPTFDQFLDSWRTCNIEFDDKTFLKYDDELLKISKVILYIPVRNTLKDVENNNGRLACSNLS